MIEPRDLLLQRSLLGCQTGDGVRQLRLPRFAPGRARGGIARDPRPLVLDAR